MDGRVERRIDDKLYFILDEVGDSSDCESEAAIHSDLKKSETLIPADSLMSINNTTETTAVKNFNDETSDSERIESVNHNKNLLPSNTLNTDAESSKRNDKNESGDSLTNKSPRYNCSYSDDSIAVDMELDSDSESIEPKAQPLLRVTFRDEAIEKLLKSSFVKFISQKFEDCTIITNSESSLELEVYDKNPKKLLEDNLLDFNLDTTPGDNYINIPNYGKAHDLVLSDKSVEIKENNEKQSFGMCCFNCLGNHNLRDCTKVKDFQVINKNKIKFQDVNRKALKASRYHLDKNQKFAHLVPGVISKKLRNALNLKHNQQPAFIYRMRLLGYPPAWLEEAKVSHSGVALYDDAGAPVLEEDEEEGEILPEGAKDRFDITKIIEFPGFNVPLPNHFKDESKYYHCPALSKDQSKENLIKLLEPKTIQAYVKKSLKSQKSEDLSTFQDKDSLKREASPTVEEMEEKKRQLLMELNNEDPALDLQKPLPDDSPADQTPPTKNEPSEITKVGTVKNSEYGTPILKSISSFSKLPSRERFSCDVSDLLTFENLPQATGKYESMREVISKIRVSASKNQKD